jgi:cell division protein FtsX
MADNIGYTPGAGATIAADDIGGALYQRVKLAHGPDGSATDASDSAPLPAVVSRTDDLVVMLSRIVKLLESNAVVDQQQRQRIALDTIPAGVTLPTVTTVTGVTTVTTVTTVTALANATAIAGMDREQYINIAKSTYAQSIRARLEFV